MKRFAILTLAVAVAFGLLAGTAAASEPGELLIWADADRIEVLQEFRDEFEEDLGVPINFHEKEFDAINDDLGVEGPAGEGPDVFIGAHDWLGELVADGLVEPIEMDQELIDQFEDVGMEAFTFEDDIYGLPYAMESIALIYNRDLVPEAPETFDEFAEIVRDISDEDDKYGFALPQPDPYHTYPFMTALGGYVFGFDEVEGWNPYDVGLNNEGAVEGLSRLNELYADGSVPYVDFDTMEGLFVGGELGMMVTGPWVFPALDDADIDYGVAQIPHMNDNPPQPFVGVQGIMISSFTENPILAQTLVTELMADEDIMYRFYELEPRPPVHKAAAEDAADDPHTAGILESAADGTPMPAIPEMSAVWGAWEDALDLILTQEQDVGPALDDAVELIEEEVQN